MITMEDQTFLLCFPSDERVTPIPSQTYTHTLGFALPLQSPSVYQTFQLCAVISFTWSLSFIFFTLSFHSLSACEGNENRGGTLWLNCSLFMPPSCVNMELSSVNWILQMVVTEGLHGDVKYHWDTTQFHTCSCHIFLLFKSKLTSC